MKFHFLLHFLGGGGVVKHGGPKVNMFCSKGGGPRSPACAWEDITGPGARPKTGASKGKWLENHQNNHHASKKLLLAGFERPPNRTLDSEKGCIFSAGLGPTIEIFQGLPDPRPEKYINCNFRGPHSPRDGGSPL